MSDLKRLVSHPFDILRNVVDEFLVFFDWVGVVESEVTGSTADFCLHEIESHCFAVADMQVSVGFWWESGEHSFSEVLFPPVEVFLGVEGGGHFSAN